jgi:hypothetical protein
MSTLEEFELALAKAQAAIAGLRRTPAAAPGAARDMVRDTVRDTQAAAPTAPAPTAPPAAPAPLSIWLKAALIVFCVGVAFLQYYYIDVALEIFSMPAAFHGPSR